MRLLEVKQPNIIVVYGGGFQPFHEGHASSYREAKAAFPGAYFFVAASNVTSERPFEFKEKQFLAKQAGVVDPFIQVGTMSYVNDNGRKVTSTPLNPLEALKQFNPEKDVLVIVRSERDPMKTTDVSYYQPWQGIQSAEPFSKHAYVLVTKKHDFTIAGNPVYSGSQVRELYSGADDKTKLTILQDLYPQSRQLDKIKQIFDKRLAVTEGVAEDSSQKTFTVVYYSKKTDRNVTKTIKATNQSQVWDKLKSKGIDVVSVKEQGLNEFAPGNGGGESGRWYTDDQMTDLVGDGWWNDLDVSGTISKQEMIQEAQAWLDDQGFSVHVLNCKVNDDDMEWFIEGSFQNSSFAKKDVAEDSSSLKKLHDALWTVISEQTIDEETINEIDPGMIANLYSVFPTVAKIIVSNALNKARKEAKETSLMIDVMKKHANNQPVTPEENEAMLTQFKDIVSYGLSTVAGVLTGAVAGPAAGASVALAGAYKKELLTLLQTKGPAVLIGMLKSKGKLDVVDILSAKLLGKHALPFYAPAKLTTEVDEASLATMRDYFAGDENAQDPTTLAKQRTWFDKTKDKNGRPTVDKRFRSPAEYQAWLKQNKLKQISDSEEYNLDEEAANLLEYLRKIHKRWAIVSKKEGRPLVYFKGDGRPSKEWVEKQERRINHLKHKK